MGREKGLTEQQLMAISEYAESDAFTESERIALRLADAMSASPAEVPDDLYQALTEHYQPAQQVELISAIAWENYRARFNRAFDIGPDGFSEGAFCVLPAPPGG